ncbi:MFS transporter [Corynebacterium timonense]|uniref:Major Facilitator Superfamily protein n=1 Tax=Corynebacterium timonense TaxID=441500 RepID=A0A1H1M906_9CORY|nr:MFS transporter [Corynebacterium timonense]SDR83283.1 Major Facilitator Superfamily protein [Corynebacterium timonense]
MTTIPAAGEKLPQRQVWPLMLALLSAVFAFQLNASMLAPALATMEVELNATTAEIGLTQTAFFTSAALFSLFMPRWGDLVGRRKVLVGMMLLTAVGSVVAALAPNVTVLFIGRVIQGVSGPTVALTSVMLRQAVREEKQFALLIGVLTSINGGIAGVDALLGGWLTDSFGFRAVFWFIGAVALLAAVCTRFGLAENAALTTHPMDWKGVVPLVVAVGVILTALNEAGQLEAANWFLVAVLILVGVVALVVFWRFEDSSAHPLVSTDLLRQRRTWGLLATTTLTMTGIFAVMNGLVPNLAQDDVNGPGLSAAEVSWWTLTPYAIAGLIFGPISGYIAGRIGYKAMLQIGIAGAVASVVFGIVVVDNPTPALLLAVSIAAGITYAGIANIMLGSLGVVLAPKSNQGYLPGMNAGAFNLGAGISFTVIFAAATTFQAAEGGYKAGMITGLVLLVFALAASFLIPRPETIPDTLAAEGR